MGSLRKNIQLTLEFLKARFLVLHFSYYTMTFLMMLSVILLSLLVVLLSTLWPGIWFVATTRVSFWTWIWPTRHWTGARSGLLFLKLAKLNLLHLTSLVTGAVDMKIDGSILEKPSFKIEGLSFSSNLNRDSCIAFIANVVSKKLGV